MKRAIFFSMKLNEFFAERLKAARAKRGYSQSKLGEISGISSKTIAKYETAVIIPNIENFKKLVTALEVNANYFFFEHATMEDVPKVKDPVLYDRYFVLEKLNDEERKAVLMLLDSLIARKKLQELKIEYAG